MGQTLPNGIYLPAEGERNCYDGLEGNWRSLDSLISTVAGKASATHTHGNITNDGKVGTDANKPLITGTGGVVQAGSFGNQANTFCEGNDSRLSDARTPVAHTHGKADITDLFNSANTWTGDNTFSNTLNVQTGYALGTLPQAESAVALFTGRTTDSNFVTGINFYQSPTKGTGLRFTIRNKWDNNGYSTTGTTRNAHFELLQSIDKTAYMQWEGYVNNGLYPLANNTYDLGSSSYQWNNLYAKNYYYNGTAWGLDKANEWTATNTFSSATNSVFCFKFGTSGSYSDIRWMDNNGSHYATLRGRVNELSLGLQYSSASAWYNGASITISNNGNVQIKTYDGTEPWTVNFTPVGVYPTSDKALELGTSTHKWKTLNGINPGALSLPDLASDGYIDLSDNISANTEYSYTPTVDGWLALYVQTTGFHAENAVGIFTGGGQSNSYRWACSATSAINLPRAAKYHGAVMLPVKAGLPYLCWITIDSSTTLSTKRLYFYKATGNV